jgi:hypothetical protein
MRLLRKEEVGRSPRCLAMLVWIVGQDSLSLAQEDELAEFPCVRSPLTTLTEGCYNVVGIDIVTKMEDVVIAIATKSMLAKNGGDPRCKKVGALWVEESQEVARPQPACADLSSE